MNGLPSTCCDKGMASPFYSGNGRAALDNGGLVMLTVAFGYSSTSVNKKGVVDVRWQELPPNQGKAGPCSDACLKTLRRSSAGRTKGASGNGNSQTVHVHVGAPPRCLGF